MGDEYAAARERHAAAQVLAPTLVGLATDDAVSRAESQGFMVQVVRDVMTAELALGRIRMVDDAGVVVRAWAG